MAATDIAVVGYAQTQSVRRARESEVQLLVPIVTEALERAGLDRRDKIKKGTEGCINEIREKNEKKLQGKNILEKVTNKN